MPLLLNATNEEVTLKVGGNYFNFKPNQLKHIYNTEIAQFIAVDKKESGIVVLPPEFDDPESDLKNTPEGKAIIDRLREEGLNHYLNYHRAIIANNQVSLRRDLAQQNIQIDPAVMATPGEIASMKIVAKYQKASKDAEAEKQAEVEKLLKEIG